jgi:DNA-binding NarL/FixJ family response regulator
VSLHPDATVVRPIRVALADDSFLVREAITHLLADEPKVAVVAVCADLQTLMYAVEEEQPDVVVTDIRMPPSGTDEGIRIAQQLRETHPEIGVVVLSQFTDPVYGLALLDDGSDGRAYLLKERIHHRHELIAAIEAVAEGRSVIDAKVVEGLIAARRRVADSPVTELTPREVEILALIARSHSNQAIADELVLTKRAVEKHINAIFMKLNLSDAHDVSRRVKAALIYLSDQGSA